MIAKGNQRGGGRNLARHLTNARDNDHVEIHDIRGVASEDVLGAFLEIEAGAAAARSRCTQPFFSVSFNPPPGLSVGVDRFEQAFAAVEKKFGLEAQPRVVIFHEKEGRRHAHAVWSRIDTETGKAIQLSHSRLKLRDVSRDLYRMLGVEPPEGLKDRARADPLNYDRKTWQQAKRLEEDPRDLKALIRDAFASSDSRPAFEAALERHALTLARGDRRGFVVVHHTGEPLSLTRYAGFKTKELTARLGDPAHLPTLDQVRSMLRDRMTAAAERRIEEARARHRAELRPLQARVQAVRSRHREERGVLDASQAERWRAEELARANRLRTGVMGLWDRVTGKYGRIAQENAAGAAEGRVRDRDERQGLIDRQMTDRRALQQELLQARQRHARQSQHLRGELGIMLAMSRDGVREAFMEHAEEIEARKASWQARRGGGEGTADAGGAGRIDAAREERIEAVRRREAARRGSGPDRDHEPDHEP